MNEMSKVTGPEVTGSRVISLLSTHLPPHPHIFHSGAPYTEERTPLGWYEDFPETWARVALKKSFSTSFFPHVLFPKPDRRTVSVFRCPSFPTCSYPNHNPPPPAFQRKMCFSPILRLASRHLAGYKSTEWREGFEKHTAPGGEKSVARTRNRLFHHCLGDRPMEWKVLLIYRSSTQFSYLIFLNKVRFLVTGNKPHIAVLNNKEWLC